LVTPIEQFEDYLQACVKNAPSWATFGHSPLLCEQFEDYLQARVKDAPPGSVIAGLHAACTSARSSTSIHPRLFAPNVFFMVTAGHETTTGVVRP
jgi:hypothetical protein